MVGMLVRNLPILLTAAVVVHVFRVILDPSWVVYHAVALVILGSAILATFEREARRGNL